MAQKPLVFHCAETLPMLPAEIAHALLDLDRWSDWKGYGPLPGIRRAEFELRTPEILGSRIRVQNTDGSSHVEQIVVWEPQRRVALQFGEFSRPLSRLAEKFIETLDFAPHGAGTRVTRQFELYPKSWAARPAMWLISLPFRRAMRAHLRQLRCAAEAQSNPRPRQITSPLG